MSECVSVCICVVSALRLCSFLFHFKSVDSFLILASTSDWIYPTIITVISTRRARVCYLDTQLLGFTVLSLTLCSPDQNVCCPLHKCSLSVLCAHKCIHTHTHTCCHLTIYLLQYRNK